MSSTQKYYAFYYMKIMYNNNANNNTDGRTLAIFKMKTKISSRLLVVGGALIHTTDTNL